MIYEFNTDISKIDELKAEMQVLLPVLHAARKELGEDRANQLIRNALITWSQERFKRIGAGLTGTPKEKWDAYEALNITRMKENDLNFEMLRQDEAAVEYNVSRCVYAEFFRELGEPELGLVLCCDQDFHIVEQITYPDVEYSRTQTLMQGASFCDIRWRVNCAAEAPGS